MSVQILVRVPDEIHPALIERAQADGLTVQAVMLTGLAHYLGVETPIRKRGGQPAAITTVKPGRERKTQTGTNVKKRKP